MSSACCGGASKALAKAATLSAPQNPPTTDLLTAEPTKSECCKGKPVKSVKNSCGC